MANQKNFKTNINQLAQQYTKYTVSRVVDNKADDLLDMEVPADFSEALLENNIEINVYSLADNSLIFSDFIPNSSQAISTETLQYPDNTQRKLLYIDFSKLPELILPIGQYEVILNFFANEVGAYDNRILKINKISPSRKEVELKLTDLTKQSNLEQFAIPRINTTWIEPVLKQIFNQSGSEQLNVPASSAKIDSSSIYQNFASGSGQKLIQYGFDEDRGTQIGINTIAQNILNNAYPLALSSVQKLISSGSSSFTETQLDTIVINAIDIAYDTALEDEKNNPQRYRFDLI
jgi:hypothetical protein